MRKTLTLATFLLCTVAMYAQKDVTKFLGIPVDGSKAEMIQKLKAKGFTSHPENEDVLTGEFNGSNVNIFVLTNNNKVWRIGIRDIYPQKKINIKMNFNKLCLQFMNNKKYIPASTRNYLIPEKEDISYGILVDNKKYDAGFYQLPYSVESFEIQQELQSFYMSKYTEEQISNLTEKQKSEIIAEFFSYLREKYSKKLVWFSISEDTGEYYINIFYDNVYNQSNGEDL